MSFHPIDWNNWPREVAPKASHSGNLLLSIQNVLLTWWLSPSQWTLANVGNFSFSWQGISALWHAHQESWQRKQSPHNLQNCTGMGFWFCMQAQHNWSHNNSPGFRKFWILVHASASMQAQWSGVRHWEKCTPQPLPCWVTEAHFGTHNLPLSSWFNWQIWWLLCTTCWMISKALDWEMCCTQESMAENFPRVFTDENPSQMSLTAQNSWLSNARASQPASWPSFSQNQSTNPKAQKIIDKDNKDDMKISPFQSVCCCLCFFEAHPWSNTINKHQCCPTLPFHFCQGSMLHGQKWKQTKLCVNSTCFADKKQHQPLSLQGQFQCNFHS